jgi:multidrug resistance efflux pump
MTMKHLLSRAGFIRFSLGLLLVVVLIGGSFTFFWSGGRDAVASPADNDNVEPEQSAILVKSVYPRFDKSFTMIERRPADVHPYYQSELETRVPGLISRINAAPGVVVKKDDVLVEVAVPDLKARVEQREAEWKHARAQVKQMEAAIEVAEADVNVAASRIDATRAKWRSDQAYHKFRQQQYKRYADLLANHSIDARLVDEQEDHLTAAYEAVNASEEAVKKASAQKVSAEARLKQAKADLEAAKSKIDVAQAEWDYAKAMLAYATVRAPFDGTIVRRNVDPGDFVQNAATGHVTPLVTIQRNDIVTVVVRVPDTHASFITPQTEAIFETPVLPGIKIHGKVTRFPNSLENPESDRTMPVEVDLWNGDADAFLQLQNNPEFLAGLKPGMPGDPNKGLPIVPQIQGKLAGGRQMRLLPGTFGQMTLILRQFDNSHMLPSSAIVTKGGYTYIYVVQDGKAHLQPVKVQVDDGKLVKVELLNRKGEIVGDLTGKENVIVTNQAELSEGQPVKPTLIEDWRSLGAKKDKN